MVGFIPLNLSSEDSITEVLMTIDHTLQFGEDEEIREPRQKDFDDEEDDGEDNDDHYNNRDQDDEDE